MAEASPTKRRRTWRQRVLQHQMVGSGAGVSSAALAKLGPYGQGLAIIAADNSMAIVSRSTPANNYAGTPQAKLSITRSGANATYFDSAQVLQTASANVLRRCYDPRKGSRAGYLIEPGRTNVVLWNRDLTNAAWTASNVTAAKDQTGIDGVSNSASSLLATAGNGTCLQAITLASSARFQYAYVKRLVGTGTIEMTMDNGTTWTGITVTSSWSKLSIPTQTLANPTVGFRIVTSGDKIAVDYVQNENGTTGTSPIAVTTVAVARSADVISIAPSLFPYNQPEGTLYAKFTTAPVVVANQRVFSLDNGAVNRVADFYANSATNFAVYGANGGVNPTTIGSGGVTGLTEYKFAIRYRADDFAWSINGGTSGTDVTCPTISTAVQLRIGSDFSGANQGAIWLEEFMYLPSGLTNGGLESLSAFF